MSMLRAETAWAMTKVNIDYHLHQALQGIEKTALKGGYSIYYALNKAGYDYHNQFELPLRVLGYEVVVQPSQYPHQMEYSIYWKPK